MENIKKINIEHKLFEIPFIYMVNGDIKYHVYLLNAIHFLNSYCSL